MECASAIVNHPTSFKHAQLCVFVKLREVEKITAIKYLKDQLICSYCTHEDINKTQIAERMNDQACETVTMAKLCAKVPKFPPVS